MNSKEIYNFLNGIYPFSDQEKWDNSTSYIVNDNDVKTIIVCLDITKNIVQIAVDNNVDLIISHHPFLIKEENASNFHTRKLLGKLSNNNINIITIHTPFDRSIFGMNINLANKLKLTDIKFCEDNCTVVGKTTPILLKKFAKFAKSELNSNFCYFLERFENKIINKVAICGGSGFSSIFSLNHKAFDVFITCDLKHHNWVDSVDLNIPIICLNHNIENIFIDVIIDKLQSVLPADTNFIKAKSAIKIRSI